MNVDLTKGGTPETKRPAIVPPLRLCDRCLWTGDVGGTRLGRRERHRAGSAVSAGEGDLDRLGRRAAGLA
jgi:hypothetical protein